jgi:histidine ammonia-lyase
MGSIAARNCCSVLENTEKIIAIEFLCACQGIDFLKPLKCGRGTNIAYTAIRSSIRHITHDIVISRYINSVHKLITSANFLPEIENSIGSLN